MFFTSYEFIFFLLPVGVLGFYALRRYGKHRLSLVWLLALSLFFYWTLDANNIFALAASIGLNFLAVLGVNRFRTSQPRLASVCLVSGIVFNILFLLCFKYLGLFMDSMQSIAVPLGISFFTLQQIAYLVSTYTEDKSHRSFLDYFLFNSFFPYVIAGPMVLKKEVSFQQKEVSPRIGELLLPGITLFGFGLVKKVVLADSIAPYVSTIFEAAAHGSIVTPTDAWMGAILYTLQIYFDFSGYSDMAVGIALLFGLNLPRNFHSPYKATSIMEFWRRWHMSVTRFFTQYVYMVLAVKCMRIAKRQELRGLGAYLLQVAVPMMATFLLIGVWHGAGSNFVLFGLLMGIALSVNHGWNKLKLARLPDGLGWVLTMLVVIVGMVFDRSANTPVAFSLLQSMIGLQGTAQPLLNSASPFIWVLALGIIAVACPNTHEIMGKYPLVLKESWDDLPKWPFKFQWTPSLAGLGISTLAFSLALVFIPKAANFLYYRF